MMMNTTMTLPRSVLALCLCALASLMLVTTGCKSEGDKFYDEGKELRKRQMTDDALVAFERAAELYAQEGNEKLDRPYMRMASIYKERQDFENAARYYELAIEAAPDEVGHHDKYMGVLISLHRFDDAMAVYEGIKDHPSLRYDIKARQELAARYDQLTNAIAEAEAKAAAALTTTPEAAVEAAVDAATEAAPAQEAAPAEQAPALEAPAEEAPAQE